MENALNGYLSMLGVQPSGVPQVNPPNPTGTVQPYQSGGGGGFGMKLPILGGMSYMPNAQVGAVAQPQAAPGGVAPVVPTAPSTLAPGLSNYLKMLGIPVAGQQQASVGVPQGQTPQYDAGNPALTQGHANAANIGKTIQHIVMMAA